MEKKQCLCRAEMELIAEGKYDKVFRCHSCNRICVADTTAGYQAWYQLETRGHTGETPSTYRVWFDDGSATLIDALGETQARCIVEVGIANGQYHGKIDHIEKL